MNRTAERADNALLPTPSIRFQHPVSLEGVLRASDVAVMAHRALNWVDSRLVDHGLRVAALLDGMLAQDGSLDSHHRGIMRNVALLHDVGAYHTEEIDRMVVFETDNVWQHSFYGYLFFKELSPFYEYADVVLYHHMPNNLFTHQDATTRFLSQVLQVADRVDVLLMGDPDLSAQEVARNLAESEEGRFTPQVIQLFLEAEREYELLDLWRSGAILANQSTFVVEPDTGASAEPYLDMLVHVIDFRSRHTVAHTVTTAWLSYELARRMLPAGNAVRDVYVAGLLHDLGKIGIPLSILEKPGKLDAQEMAVMRTHVALTEEVIGGLVSPGIVATAIRHHEKLDGSGYPCGLCVQDLSMADRIVAVADIVSALVGTRSYKEAYAQDRVVSILEEQRAKGLIDSQVVDVVVRDYEDIMQEVAEACRPVETIYRRVQDEYRWLVGELCRKATHDQGLSEEELKEYGFANVRTEEAQA